MRTNTKLWRSRKAKKELARPLQSENPGLEVVHAHAAGIDVGNSAHYAAVRPDRDSQPVRRFECFTADLYRLADWLQNCGVKTVALQSTGVYWIPLYDILEERGFQVYLVNARHTKNLPGRKSDVQESQWLLKLHTYGLLNNSFQPPSEIRVLRTYWRQRLQHVTGAATCVQRMQKALTQMNIQLANVISDLSGVTGQLIVRAIVAGERDPRKLAELSHPRIQASRGEIAKSLEGNWRQELIFVLQQEIQMYDTYQRRVAECDQQLQKHLTRFADTAPSRTKEELPPKKKGRLTLMHEGNQVREFYSALPRPVRVGIEATGSMHWFLNLMDELGIECQVGHPAKIRAAEPRKQKHDQRDADLILTLLAEDRFPTIWLPNQELLDLRALLLHRHHWVRMRTRIQNALRAIALAHGLRPGSGLWSHDGQNKIALLPLLPHTASRRSALQALYGKMESEIANLTQQVAEQAGHRAGAQRLMTHPGVGPVTALATDVFLGDPQRFVDGKALASYVGIQKGLGKARVAVARKLGIRLWIMLRDAIDYQEFCRRGQKQQSGAACAGMPETPFGATSHRPVD